MSTNKKNQKKSTAVIPRSLTGGLFSSDKFDEFFDDFLSTKPNAEVLHRTMRKENWLEAGRKLINKKH